MKSARTATLVHKRDSSVVSASKKLPVTVAASTLFAAVYQVLIIAGADIRIVLTLFVMSPFVLCYMVYVILKSDAPPASSFEDHFYEKR